ncbi:MAG: PKD domain-containing protein [Candidatus Bathyarchaeota archaeon]|nr:PKD domain-containing protein [Candidatus Bathyarchaeota archaeon]
MPSPQGKIFLVIIVALLFVGSVGKAEATWVQSGGPTANGILSIFMIDGNNGWALAGNPTIILHWDGSQWTLNKQTDCYLLDIFMLNSQVGWAVGSRTVLNQTSSVIMYFDGEKWTEDSSVPNTNGLTSISMVDGNNGWATGNNGRILKWSQHQWVEDQGESFYGLTSVCMISPSEGWAVGKYGNILRYNGQSWLKFSSPTTCTLQSVSKGSPTQVWAVGEHGTIIFFDGLNWVNKTSGTEYDLNEVHMVNNKDGWIVGASGILMHWMGQSWSITQSPTGQYLDALFMLSTSDFWIGGAAGELWHWHVNAPTAHFMVAQVEDGKVTFNAQASQCFDGSIIKYEWDFGDGQRIETTEATIEHTFQKGGSFNVTLTVKDSNYLSSNLFFQSVEIDFFVIPWLLIEVAVPSAIIIITPVGAVIWWKRKKKQNPLSGVLPLGWQFYTKPTTGEPPGTIFRITSDKKKFWVKQLDVQIHPCDESAAKYTRKATMGILLRFNGLETVSINQKSSSFQQVTFEMKEPIGEATYDADLDPLLSKWLDSPNFEFRPEDRYFVIRDATKTKAINYKLTRQQFTALKEQAALKKLQQATQLNNNDQEQFVFPQKFSAHMRIMFNAEEIKMKPVKGKIKLSHHRVKGVLEWTE